MKHFLGYLFGASFILALFLFMAVPTSMAMNGYAGCSPDQQPYFDDCYIGCGGDQTCQAECCMVYPACCTHAETDPCEQNTCGDGACLPECGEDCVDCSQDCGQCPGEEENECENVTCGDYVCDETCGERCDDCVFDCGICNNGPVWCCYYYPSLDQWGIDYVLDTSCQPGPDQQTSIWSTEQEARANCPPIEEDEDDNPCAEAVCGDGMCWPECDETCYNCATDCDDCPPDGEPGGEPEEEEVWCCFCAIDTGECGIDSVKPYMCQPGQNSTTTEYPSRQEAIDNCPPDGEPEGGDDPCGQATCGDGQCWPECDEECYNCPDDCGVCEEDPCLTSDQGDGMCRPECDENCENSPQDCGECYEPEGLCDPSVCGDGYCAPECGEECGDCAEDCGACYDLEMCGDNICGDGICEGQCGEECGSCPSDCGVCDPCLNNEEGDGYCLPECGENCENSQGDCGICSSKSNDGVCSSDEDCITSPDDCGRCSSATIPEEYSKSGGFVVAGGTCCTYQFLPVNIAGWLCPWLWLILIIALILVALMWWRRTLPEDKREDDKPLIICYLFPLVAVVTPIVVAFVVDFCWGIIVAILFMILRLPLWKIRGWDDFKKKSKEIKK